MQLEIYQWLGPLLSIFYITRTLRQYSRGKYSPRNTIIWIIFWLGIALLAIMPGEVANSFAKGLGFSDQVNAIIFVALGLLFSMVFYLSAAVNRVENQMTALIRQLALHEFSIKNTPSDSVKLEKVKPQTEITILEPTIESKENGDEEIPNEGKMPKN